MTSEPEAKPNGPRLWFSKAKRLRFLVEGVALGSVANFSIPCAAVRSQISRWVRGAKAFAFKARNNSRSEGGGTRALKFTLFEAGKDFGCASGCVKS